MRSSGLRFLVIKGRLRPEFVFQFLFLFHVVVFYPHLLWGQVAAPLTGGRTIHGIVKSGNMPIPGAGVSAANTSTKEQVNTSTDVDGSYWLRIPADGRYTVRVQMAAFAGSAQEVVLDATHQDVQANFELVLLSRAREAGNDNDQRRANAGGRGFQSLSVFPSEAGQDSASGSMSDVAPSGMPVPGIAPNGATESVAVSGNTSNLFNAMSADELQQLLQFGEPYAEGRRGKDQLPPRKIAEVAEGLVERAAIALRAVGLVDRRPSGACSARGCGGRAERCSAPA